MLSRTNVAGMSFKDNAFASATNAEGLLSNNTNMETVFFGESVFGKFCNIEKMFENCKELTTIVSPESWNISGWTDVFAGCTALSGYNGTIYSENAVGSEMAILDGGTSSPGYFSNADTTERVAYYKGPDDVIVGVFGVGEAEPTYNGYSLIETRWDLNSDSYLRQDITHAIFEEDVHPKRIMFFRTMLREIRLNGHLKLDNQTDLSYFLYGTKCEEVDLSSLDVSKVTDLDYVFAEMQNLHTLNLTGWDTSNITECDNMFANSNNISNLTISNDFYVKKSSKPALIEIENTSVPQYGETLFYSGWARAGKEELFSTQQLIQRMQSSNDKAGTWQRVGSNEQPEGWAATYGNDPDNPVITLFGGNDTQVPDSYEELPRIAVQRIQNMKADSVKPPADAIWRTPSMERIIFIGKTIAPPCIAYWFEGKDDFAPHTIERLDLFDVSNVTDIQALFRNLDMSGQTWDLSMWDVSKVTQGFNYWHDSLFYNFTIDELSLRNWQINVKDIVIIYDINTYNLDVSGWKLSYATSVKYNFRYSIDLIEINMTEWDFGDTARGISFADNFVYYYCPTILDLSSWKIPEGSNIIGRYNQRITASKSLVFPKNFITTGYDVFLSNGKWEHRSLDGELVEVLTSDEANALARSGADLCGSWEFKSISTSEPGIGPDEPDPGTYPDDAVNGYLYGTTLLIQNNSTPVPDTFEGKALSRKFFDICNASEDYTYKRWNNYNIKKAVIAEKIYPENVTHMFSMSRMTELQGVENIDISRLTSLDRMFAYSAISSIDLNSWDVSHITSMAGLFAICSQLADVKIDTWDTSNVTTMQEMFSGCSALKTLDISNFDTSNVLYMQSMFSNCKTLSMLDISTWKTPKVKQMDSMFRSCSSLTEIRVDSIGSPYTTNISQMFASCSSLKHLMFNNFDTSAVTNMSNMFWRCSSLEKLDVSSFDTKNVTDMSYLFNGCSSLSDLEFSTFDTTNVTNMEYMFSGCSSLTELDLTHFETLNVTNMSHMFNNCTKLKLIDLSNFDTTNNTSTYAMFYGCVSLINLDLSSFNTLKITNTSEMFRDCVNLRQILVSNNWNISALSYSGSARMFNRCYNIIGAAGTEYDNTQTSSKYAVVDTPSTPGYLTLASNSTVQLIADAAAALSYDNLNIIYHLNSDTLLSQYSTITEISYSMMMGKNNTAYKIGIPPVFMSIVNKGWTIAYWTTTPTVTPKSKIFHTGDMVSVSDSTRLPFSYSEQDAYAIDLYAHWQRTTYPVSGEKTIDFTLIGGQQITFEDLPEGTTYTIVEKTSGKWSLVSSTNASGTITPGENTQSHFINQPAPQEVLIELPIVKTLNGEPAEGFSFEIYENDTLIDTQQSDERGSASFKMRYEQMGSHTYKIKEKVGDNKSIIYDDTVYEVYVEVSKDNAGKLVAQLLMPQDSSIISFENETHADRRAEVSVAKNAIGFDLEDKQFAFSMTDTETGNVAATARNDADGTVSFSLTYPNTGETLEKTYEIREIATDDMMLGKDIKYDDKVIRVKVSFIDDAATPTITFINEAGNAIDETSGMPTFTNTLALNLPFTGGELALISLLALLSVSLVGAGIFVRSRRENTQAAMSSE